MISDYFRRWITAFLAVLFLSVTPPAAKGGDQQRNSLKVSTSDNLTQKIASAKAGTTILLQDGTYKLSRPLILRTPGVSIRSESGNREKVILDGKKVTEKLTRQNCVNEIISIRASNVTVADLSIRHARDHGIHISPENKGNIKNVVMHNIHIYDCGQQLIKVNSNGGKPLYWTDECILEDSLIEFVDNSIMHDMGKHFYTGGLDVHGGNNWIVRRNIFRNIQREGKLMEHAIHMWSKSRGTIVEQNQFIDCYRAIGFGMKREARGFTRNYPDNKGNSPYFDHVEGVIRNNFIFNRKGIHLESGIELMNVINTKVYHNTVVSHDKPFSSIEYRWPNTRVQIANNIVSQRIMRRNDAQATLKGNIEQAPASLFLDYKTGDLHLSPKASQAIGKGIPLKNTATKLDIDGDKRDSRPDTGADEQR